MAVLSLNTQMRTYTRTYARRTRTHSHPHSHACTHTRSHWVAPLGLHRLDTAYHPKGTRDQSYDDLVCLHYAWGNYDPQRRTHVLSSPTAFAGPAAGLGVRAARVVTPWSVPGRWAALQSRAGWLQQRRTPEDPGDPVSHSRGPCPGLNIQWWKQVSPQTDAVTC